MTLGNKYPLEEDTVVYHTNNYFSDVWINEIDLDNCSISSHEKQHLLHLLTKYRDVFVKSYTKQVLPSVSHTTSTLVDTPSLSMSV